MHELPASGDVVIAHPDLEPWARSASARHDIPYFLSSRSTTECLNIVDVSLQEDPITWCEPYKGEPHEMGVSAHP